MGAGNWEPALHRITAPLPAALIMMLCAAVPAAAQMDADPAVSTGLWQRQTLTGDWGGFRTSLADHGFALGATETSEILGNLSGGVRRGAVYEGRLELDLDLDLEKAAGWGGATVHVSA